MLRVSGALAVFDRNPDYVPRDEPPDGLAGGRRVMVDRVEWHVIPDASTAAAALQSGEVDLIEQPALELLPLLRRNKDVQIRKQTDLSNQTMLRPNSLHPPFDNPKARLALAYLVDQADILAAGFGDKENWQECRSYFICGGPYGTLAGTEGLHPDVAKAKQLLAEAGYKGEKLVFPSTHEIAWIGQMAEVVADEMKQAGMNVEIEWGGLGHDGWPPESTRRRPTRAAGTCSRPALRAPRCTHRSPISAPTWPATAATSRVGRATRRRRSCGRRSWTPTTRTGRRRSRRCTGTWPRCSPTS